MKHLMRLRRQRAHGGDGAKAPIPPPESALDRIPLAALVLANLAPAVGVLFFGWDARYLLLLYWLENLVIGGWTLLRMLSAGGYRVLPQAAFFSFHYSFFCAGHGMFIIELIGGEVDDSAEDGFPLMLPLNMLRGEFAWIAQEMPALLGIPLLAFIISHGVSTVYHHFIGREDARRDADDIMFDPYKRIVLLHIAILLGAMAILATGAETVAPALLLLVALKTGIDIHQHRSAHRKRRRVRNENGAEDGAAKDGD